MYVAVWEHGADPMVFMDREGLLDCNEAALRLLGLASTRAVLGRPLADFAPKLQPHGKSSREYISAQVNRALADGECRFDCQLACSDGSLFVVDAHLHRLQIGGGQVAHAVLRDITARWESERKLRTEKDAIEANLNQLTYFDAVTHLPNRRRFHEQAELALSRAERLGRPIATASIAVNDLGVLNNTLGHGAGDTVLREVAQRLSASVRENDIVARISGSVFGILFDGCTEESADRAARELLAASALPVRIGDHDIRIRVSIGLSLLGRDGHDLWELLQNAETAMYRAKAAGTDAYRFFSGEMHTVAFERLMLENRLRQALDHGEFIVHYQPLVSAHDERIVGAEALVRWQHPDLGLIEPDRFIPLAEESGLIIPLGEWVLDTACRQARAWQVTRSPPIEMCVNLSPRQFRRPDLTQKVAEILAASGLDPRLLVLELTEGALMDHAEATLTTLADLRALGVRLAVDDFGTGYSSLAYLRRFSLNKLKVDKSFVRDIGSRSDDVVIAQAIVNLGRELHLEVVAEGIETAAECAALRSYGCEYLQGSYFSRPLPVGEFEALLRAS
jgi:diguanylate cyclase (GGDEF)-like protein/PAS domain S-box-containing protein